MLCRNHSEPVDIFDPVYDEPFASYSIVDHSSTPLHPHPAWKESRRVCAPTLARLERVRGRGRETARERKGASETPDRERERGRTR